MSFLEWIKPKIIHEFMRFFTFPKVYKIGREFHVASVEDTINSLIDSNKSLSRFGDGEIGWILGRSVFPQDVFSFEKMSNNLRHNLIKVLTSNCSELEIGLSPIKEYKDHHYKYSCRRTVKLTMSKLGTSWMKYLNKNKQYYNTNVTRSYSAYKNYSYSRYLFNQTKKIWNNRNILIIEGIGTRLGINDNLFDNVKCIHRIECPSINAFESYKAIYKKSLCYLNNHKIDLTLIALGPTATILVHDLCIHGHRAIDIGHIDVEYEWFLRHKMCNIPYKCVNEVPGGQKIMPIHNSKYKKEIITVIH